MPKAETTNSHMGPRKSGCGWLDTIKILAAVDLYHPSPLQDGEYISVFIYVLFVMHRGPHGIYSPGILTEQCGGWLCSLLQEPLETHQALWVSEPGSQRAKNMEDSSPAGLVLLGLFPGAGETRWVTVLEAGIIWRALMWIFVVYWRVPEYATPKYASSASELFWAKVIENQQMQKKFWKQGTSFPRVKESHICERRLPLPAAKRKTPNKSY